jgi:opacity protein-like surface antigen
MKRTSLVLLPAVLGVLSILLSAAPAEAQYYGPPPGGGYGYGPPPPRPMFGYRHRIHFYAGAQATGIGIIAEKTDYQAGGYLGRGGGGGGLFAGVRLGPFFALEANWNITYHKVAEDWTTGCTYDYCYGARYWSAFHLQTVDLNGKIHIPTRGPIEPYVQLGIGYAFLGISWEDDWNAYYTEHGDYIFASGFGFNIGGGLDFWLSPFVSLGGRLLYKGVRFGEPQKVASTVTYYSNFANAINVDLNVTLHF